MAPQQGAMETSQSGEGGCWQPPRMQGGVSALSAGRKPNREGSERLSLAHPST